MPTEYYLDETLSALVHDIVQDKTFSEFEPLRVNETSFLVCAMRKANADGESQPTSGEPVVIRKVSAADAVFLPGFHYKVYVDNHRFDEANDLQRRAMVHSALMRINVEVKQDAVKYSTRRPDVIAYQASVVRFGPWQEQLILLRENLNNARKKKTELAEST